MYVLRDQRDHVKPTTVLKGTSSVARWPIWLKPLFARIPVCDLFAVGECVLVSGFPFACVCIQDLREQTDQLKR